LITGYAYHKKAHAERKQRRWSRLLEPVTAL
jgi:deoxyhypusine synthase